ncbi:hypothetical protein Tco_1062034, partial [Tanacetum coccineum]
VEDQPYADDASLTAESPGHIADLESMEEDSIDYLDEPEDDDEDPEEDHTNDPADGEETMMTLMMRMRSPLRTRRKRST